MDERALETAEENINLYGFPVREFDKRRVTNPNGRSVDIKSLWSRSHEIINLDSMGYKGTEIASMLGISPTTVSNTLNSTLGRREVSNIREERDEEYEVLREEVLELTKKSLGIYKQILEEEETSIVPLKMKKETADTIVLELSGLRAPTKIDSRTVSFQLTPDELSSFKQRGLNAAKSAGKVVDIGEGK